MRTAKYIVLIALVTIAIFLMLVSEPASAQCAMCRASLAGSNNASFVRNLNIGVLVLLVPPVSIFCSIFVILKRRGSRDD
jgi:hypothetical protein